MKRFFSLLTAAAVLLSLSACSQPASSTAPDEPAPAQGAAPETSTSPAAEAADASVLIAYFSWSGNTAEMAAQIQEQTGGDLFEIVPVEPYPTDYDECGDVALAERDSNARPEIQNLPESIEQYDTIFIGYPIWWHTAPMIIGTFLESYDLSGVDVYPFTHSPPRWIPNSLTSRWISCGRRPPMRPCMTACSCACPTPTGSPVI